MDGQPTPEATSADQPVRKRRRGVVIALVALAVVPIVFVFILVVLEVRIWGRWGIPFAAAPFSWIPLLVYLFLTNRRTIWRWIQFVGIAACLGYFSFNFAVILLLALPTSYVYSEDILPQSGDKIYVISDSVFPDINIGIYRAYLGEIFLHRLYKSGDLDVVEGIGKVGLDWNDSKTGFALWVEGLSDDPYTYIDAFTCDSDGNIAVVTPKEHDRPLRSQWIEQWLAEGK